MFADQLNQAGKVRVNADDVFEAITKTMRQCRGGFACVAMIAGFGIIGFRDPNGIRPICWGRRRCGTKAKEDDAWDYMFASESVVLSSLNYGEIEELKPGMLHVPVDECAL